MDHLKSKVFSSIGWAFSSQASREICQFIVSIILARILLPKDYGLVSMATTVTGFIQMFNTMGFRSALIQKQNSNDKDYTTAFWTTLLLSVSLYIVTVSISPIAAWFFEEPILKGLMSISALGFIITALNTIHFARLEKAMDFKKISIIEICTTLISGIVSITLATNGYGVWSLVVGGIAGQVLTMPLPWYFTRWRPSYTFDKAALKELFGFGSRVTGAVFINYFARNADNLIIGKVLGSTALGYYSMAYGLMLKPLQYVSSNFSRVLFSAFSSIRNDAEKTRSAYLKVVHFISLITFPMMTGLLFVAPEFVQVVYGSKWAPIVPIFQILCLLGASQSIGSTVGTIYMSQGRADLQLKYTAIFSSIVVASFFVGVQWGVIGVAVAYAFASGGIWMWSHAIANRLIGLQMKTLLSQLVPSITASAGMYALLSVIKYFQSMYTNFHMVAGVLLFEFVLLGFFSYTLFIYIIDSAVFRELTAMFKNRYA